MTEVIEEPAVTGPRHGWFRRRLIVIGAAFVAALVVFVLFWFQPHKLFIDEHVDESIPTVPTGSPTTGATPGSDQTTAGPTSTAPPVDPVELARGGFVSLDHTTEGVALVLELADGSRFVRLEGLDTSNGPDLFVYVTSNPADGNEGAFDDDFVSLGRLKGNQGDQNYELPADVEVSRYSTVVIWCDRFDSAFGAADLAVT